MAHRVGGGVRSLALAVNEWIVEGFIVVGEAGTECRRDACGTEK